MPIGINHSPHSQRGESKMNTYQATVAITIIPNYDCLEVSQEIQLSLTCQVIKKKH